MSHEGPIADYHDREAWLQARRRMVGGSEVAALFGLHPFLTAADVYDAKVTDTEKEMTPAMRRGVRLEPVAVDYYTEETGRKVRRTPLRTLKDNPHIGASADRLVLAGDDHPTMPLEVKVPGRWVFEEIRQKGMLPYMGLQGQQEAMVFGSEVMSYAVYHADSDRLLYFDVPAERKIHEQIVEGVSRFWFEFVVPGIRPDENVLTGNAVIELPEVEGELKTIDDPAFRKALGELLEAREIVKSATALKDQAKAAVKELVPALGWWQTETDGDRVQLRAQAGKKGFNLKALRANAPLDRTSVALALGQAIKDELITPLNAGKLAILMQDSDLDLSQFETVGNPYNVLAPYRAKAQEE